MAQRRVPNANGDRIRTLQLKETEHLPDKYLV